MNTFIAYFVGVVVTAAFLLVPALIMIKNYDKKLRELEDKHEALVKYFDERMEQIKADFHCVFETCNDLSELLKDNAEDMEDDEPDDIRIMESEEYLFSDRNKRHLWYNKKDDKLWCASKDTNFAPCVIAHPSKIVGDGLSFFGFRSNDDRAVYVRNNKLKIDFMIELEMPTIYTRENAVIIDKLDEEEEPVKDNECRIKNVDGHYEVYINGKFCCSADTMTEAAVELEKALAEERENQ